MVCEPAASTSLDHFPLSPKSHTSKAMVPFLRLLRPVNYKLWPTITRSSPLLQIPFSSYFSSIPPPPPPPPSHPLPAVGVFWDLDNKPPNSIPPYDAAVRLRLAASSFGPLRFIRAFANHHAFRHLPAPVRSARSRLRSLHRLEDSGALSPSTPYVCRVCGRNFYHHSKLLHHFNQIHHREHVKRLNRINSARGARRVQIAARLAVKMEKFNKVAGEILVPDEGCGMADELKRAGVLVTKVDDRPESADRAIREHIVDAMDRRRIGCLVLISDDSGFVGVLKEARMRCLMTVVIGDERDGALKRCADAAFSWKDVASGKARKHAGSAVGKWMDKGLLRSLEWRYEQPEDGKESGWDGFDGESEDGDDGVSSESLNLAKRNGDEPWWKLDLDDQGGSLERSSQYTKS